MKSLIALGIIFTLATACGRGQKIEELEAENEKIKIETEAAKLNEARALDEANEPEVVVVERTVTNHTNGTQTTTVEKKKMSNKTKGALIGAGAGAITGAVIDKKRPVKGAVIGGAIGAAAGLGTGAILDNKKKKEEEEKED